MALAISADIWISATQDVSLIEMKISVFLNADVSNTNADFYVMIENRDICISQVLICAFQ